MKILPWIAVLGCYALVGCSDGYKNISNRPEIIAKGEGVYYSTGTLVTVQEPFGVSKSSWKAELRGLCVTTFSTNGTPLPPVTGLCTNGTEILIERMFLQRHWENGDYIVPLGRILSGEYSGKLIDLREVCRRRFLRRSNEVNSNMVENPEVGIPWGGGIRYDL